MNDIRTNLVKFSLIILIAILLLAPINMSLVRSESGAKSYTRNRFIIVIDEGHGNVFGYKELASFLTKFNETLYMSEGVYINVYSVKGKINSSTVIGIDLLIIPPTNGSVSYTSEEGEVLLDYIKFGGSVLILGAPFDIGIGSKPDVSYLNDLLIYMKQDISLYYEAGSGDLIRDDINGDGSVIYLNKSNADEELGELFQNVNGSIKVSSCSINFRQKNNTYAIKTGSTAYRVNNKMQVSYNNSGYNVFVARKISYGLLTVIGFGEVLTNISSPYGSPWMSIPEDFQFSYNLIKWLLNLDRWVLEERKQMHPLHIYLLIGSIPIIALYPIAVRIDEKRRRKMEKKKREVKISEILKKAREKERK